MDGQIATRCIFRNNTRPRISSSCAVPPSLEDSMPLMAAGEDPWIVRVELQKHRAYIRQPGFLKALRTKSGYFIKDRAMRHPRSLLTITINACTAMRPLGMYKRSNKTKKELWNNRKDSCWISLKSLVLSIAITVRHPIAYTAFRKAYQATSSSSWLAFWRWARRRASKSGRKTTPKTLSCECSKKASKST